MNFRRLEFGEDRSEDVDFDDDMEGFVAVPNTHLGDEKYLIFTTYSLQSKFSNNIELLFSDGESLVFSGPLSKSLNIPPNCI